MEPGVKCPECGFWGVLHQPWCSVPRVPDVKPAFFQDERGRWRRVNSTENAAGYGYNLEIRKMDAHLPTDPALRKDVPIYSGFIRYFPKAMAEVAKLSRIGNDQHNPGKPLHWDRSKSGDELDALTRHLAEAGTIDIDGVRHSTKVAWRAMANLEKEIEAYQENVARLTDTPQVDPRSKVLPEKVAAAEPFHQPWAEPFELPPAKVVPHAG